VTSYDVIIITRHHVGGIINTYKHGVKMRTTENTLELFHGYL